MDDAPEPSPPELDPARQLAQIRADAAPAYELAYEEARRALEQYPADLMVAYPVGTRVNSPKNNDASLVTPAA